PRGETAIPNCACHAGGQNVQAAGEGRDYDFAQGNAENAESADGIQRSPFLLCSLPVFCAFFARIEKQRDQKHAPDKSATFFHGGIMQRLKVLLIGTLIGAVCLGLYSLGSMPSAWSLGQKAEAWVLMMTGPFLLVIFGASYPPTAVSVSAMLAVLLSPYCSH